MKKINYFLASLLLPATFGIMGCANLFPTDSSTDSNVDSSIENSVDSNGESIGGGDVVVELDAPVVSLGEDFSANWEAVDNATGYVINVNGTDVSTVTTLSLSAFTTVGKYDVKVCATDGVNKSAWSNVVSYDIYGVTLTAGDYYTLVGAETVFGGEAYSFTLTKDVNVEGTAVVKANGVVLTEADGKYTVENVSENVVITVEGLSKQTFAVTKPTDPVGYAVEGEEKAVYGENYTFTVALLEGYTNSELVVKVNDQAVVAVEGVYTVENVTEALAITVEGAVKNVYEVTKPNENAAYTFTGETSVVHGASYTFTLTVSEGYDASGLIVKVNDVAVTGSENTYTVENVSGALAITVDGLNLATYSVTLPTGVGYTLTGNETVTHGDTYTFTLAISEGYDQSFPVVSANGQSLIPRKNTYTVANVTEALVITVDGIAINLYEVSVPTGEGYTVTGDVSVQVEHGGSASFNVVASNAGDALVVKNGDVTLEAVEGVYTVENVTAATELTVKVVALLDQFYLRSNWGYANAENSTENDGSLTFNNINGTYLKEDYIKALWEAGYTHIAFDVAISSEVQDIVYTHRAKWDKYWEQQEVAANKTIRIDLSEFKEDDVYYGFDLSFRIRGAGDNSPVSEFTMNNLRAFKSPETLEWTKSSTNVYFAIEDGYYVFETHGAASISSPTEWLEKYVVKDDASQRSWRVYTDWLKKGGNTRSVLFGFGTAVNNINSVDGGWAWLNDMQKDGYADGEVFSLHTDVGGTARFKILDWVSNRNQWNEAQKVEYVNENTIKWSGADSYKLRLATTQDYVKAGYTKLTVTFKGDLGSALIWYGDDAWSNGEFAIDAKSFTDGVCTIEVDLTGAVTQLQFGNGENFTLMGNAATFSDIEISWTFSK